MEEDTMGEALRLLRIFNGYKSAELAKKLELSQSYVSELEKTAYDGGFRQICESV